MSIKSIDLNGLVKNITTTIPDPSINIFIVKQMQS